MRATSVALAAVLLLATTASAAVTAGARVEPRSIAPGEAADLAVVVQGTQQAAMPAVPRVDGLRIVYVGPETQVSIVNAQVTATVTHHFNVTAEREGTFTIQPITVQAEGQTLSAGSVTLQVSRAPGTPDAPAVDEGLALQLTAPRTTVYVNERVPVTIQLRVGAVRVGDVNYPRLLGDGFTVEPLAEPSQRQEQTAQGPVQLVEFRTAITPIRAGALSLGPASMTLSVLRDRPQRRSLFFGGTTRQQLELRSQPLVLDVRPLPEEGQPPDFAGAVGRFTLTASAAPTDVGVGDPVTLTIAVRGQGNLAAAAPAGVPASPAFRVYPVQAAGEQPPSGQGAVHRVFEQVVLPQQAGTVTLPALRLPFFDPETRAYRTATQPPIVLTVRAAPAGSGPQIVGGPAAKPAETAEQLGRDIVSIKDAPGALRPLGSAPWRSPAFWLLQLVAFALAAGVVAWDRRRQRLSGDPRLVRFGAAGRAARVGLGDARAALARGDRRACYDGVARTVNDYLAAKLDLPPGSVTADRVGDRLRAARVDGGVLDDLRALWAACEAARFAPSGDGDSDAERTLARADAIVRACERERGLVRALRAAAVLLALATAATPVAHAADTPEALFYRGNTLYGEGRFGDAAAAYEAVRAQGVTSAALEYNLGNAWLKTGDAGRAVLAYERASRLAPRDPDVAANLGFARPAGTEPVVAWWERVLFPLARRWTSRELAIAAAVAWWLLAGCVVAARVLPAAARGARRVGTVTGVVLVVLAASAAWRAIVVEGRTAAVVIAPEAVTVRFEPSPGGTAHYDAAPGTVLDVLGERGEWLQVSRTDGLRGWAERSALGLVDAAAATP